MAPKICNSKEHQGTLSQFVPSLPQLSFQSTLCIPAHCFKELAPLSVYVIPKTQIFKSKSNHVVTLVAISTHVKTSLT